MKNMLWVGCGGFLGAIFRYLISLKLSSYNRFNFPIDTLLINFFGCLLLGFLWNNYYYTTSILPIKEFVFIGLLGGFTTFSAFGLDSFLLFKSGNIKFFTIYLFGSILSGFLGIFIGTFISKNL